jgi:3-deoxy-manno-octulosonate cytidylyltransferase (CMP-KDO synthetase)
MVQHVFESARRCAGLDEVVVATDSDEVLGVCRSLMIPAEITSPEHASGTDRIFEVMTRRHADIFVNIQGDEPLLEPAHLERLLEPFQTAPATQVSTLRTAITGEEAKNPNAVKVVCDARGNALYFSRWPIPYDRDGKSSVQYFKHLGLYAYSRNALELFHSLAPSKLELAERLEQLRFLEHGVPIRIADAPFGTVGVDTEDDLRRVEQILRRRAAA